MSQRSNYNGRPGIYCNRFGKWIAQIQIDGKKKYLGSFTRAKDAEAAYEAARRERDGERDGAMLQVR